MARERFTLYPASTVDLRMIEGETTPRQADADVGVRAEKTSETEFRIQVDGSNGHPKGHVGSAKVRIAVVIVSVCGEGGRTLDGLVIAELNQVSAFWINLCDGLVGSDEKRRIPYQQNKETHQHADEVSCACRDIKP